jgi:hypothetical protein
MKLALDACKFSDCDPHPLPLTQVGGGLIPRMVAKEHVGLRIFYYYRQFTVNKMK